MSKIEDQERTLALLMGYANGKDPAGDIQLAMTFPESDNSINAAVSFGHTLGARAVAHANRRTQRTQTEEVERE